MFSIWHANSRVFKSRSGNSSRARNQEGDSIAATELLAWFEQKFVWGKEYNDIEYILARLSH